MADRTRTPFTRVPAKSHWFWIPTLCYWLEELAPLFHPMKSKTKTNRDSLAPAKVFPRLVSPTCILFEFWLDQGIVYVFCDWLERLPLVLVLRHSRSHWMMAALHDSWTSPTFKLLCVCRIKYSKSAILLFTQPSFTRQRTFYFLGSVKQNYPDTI